MGLLSVLMVAGKLGQPQGIAPYKSRPRHHTTTIRSILHGQDGKFKTVFLFAGNLFPAPLPSKMAARGFLINKGRILRNEKEH